MKLLSLALLPALTLTTGCFSYLEAGGGFAASAAGSHSGVGPSIHAQYGIVPISVADDVTATVTLGASMAFFGFETDDSVVAGGVGLAVDWGNVLHTDDPERIFDFPIVNGAALLGVGKENGDGVDEDAAFAGDLFGGIGFMLGPLQLHAGPHMMFLSNPGIAVGAQARARLWIMGGCGCVRD